MTKLKIKLLGKDSYKLKRELSLFNVTLAGVGIILGAGIYALIGIAASEAGNATWLSFLIAAIVAGFTGLSYAELSSIFKGDGGEYDYCKSAFHKKVAWLIAILIILTGVVSAAAVSLGFAGYLSSLIPIPFLLGAILLIILMSFLNFYGIKDSSRFNTLATSIEFIGLIIIILLGLYFTFTGKTHLTSASELLQMPNHFKGILQAGALVFFAYMGFETIIKLREETKNANKTIPKALLLSILITAIVYVLVAVAAVLILPHETLAASKSPLADVGAKALGGAMFTIISIIALFSTSNTVLLTMLTTSRLTYGMAKEKSLPHPLANVHKKRRTPHISVAIIGILTIAFALLGNIELVADLTTVGLFITFALVNLATIFLRYKIKRKRPFKMPLNIGNFPVLSALGVITSLFMLIFSIINLM